MLHDKPILTAIGILAFFVAIVLVLFVAWILLAPLQAKFSERLSSLRFRISGDPRKDTK